MRPARAQSPGLKAPGSSLNHEGHPTCTRCPVCGTEECNVLEQLGMFCETMCAASQAEAAGECARQSCPSRRTRRSAA